MNGDACKFSHEPLTDKSRQLLDKVSMYSFMLYFLCRIVSVTNALSSAVSYYFNVNIALLLFVECLECHIKI